MRRPPLPPIFFLSPKNLNFSSLYGRWVWWCFSIVYFPVATSATFFFFCLGPFFPALNALCPTAPCSSHAFSFPCVPLSFFCRLASLSLRDQNKPTCSHLIPFVHQYLFSSFPSNFSSCFLRHRPARSYAVWFLIASWHVIPPDPLSYPAPLSCLCKFRDPLYKDFLS